MTGQTDAYDNMEASLAVPFQHGPSIISNIKETSSNRAYAAYGAAPVGGALSFTPPPMGVTSKFASSYTNSIFGFGAGVNSYPDGGTALTGTHIKLPHIDPAVTAQKEAMIIDSVGGQQVLEIISQSVGVHNYSGTGDSDIGFPQTTPNNNNLEIEFVMRYRYVDTDTTHFQTSAGSRTVTDAALSTRVTKVLQIWNHIEVIPLSRLSEDAAVNSFGVNGDPSFAYRLTIASADDVDDIKIEAIPNETEVYELRMKIRADEDDVYNNPDYEVGADDQPFTAIIPDVQYDSLDDYRTGTYSKWRDGYMDSDTDPDNGSSKASFIVVAHASTWEDTSSIPATTSAIEGPNQNDYVIQTPYVTYGGVELPDVEVEEPVFGCTDPDAVNYNADANTDDGSCQFCDNVLVDIFESNSIDEGWDVGAYKHNADHHMFNGLDADLGSSYSGTLPASSSGIPYIGSNEM